MEVTPAPGTSSATPNGVGGVSDAAVVGAQGGDGREGQGNVTGGRLGSAGQGLRKSLSKSLLARFGSPGKVLPVGSLGTTLGWGGVDGGIRVPQRRATHSGVVESAEAGLKISVVHVRPEDFMDPDTAAQV